MPVFSAAILAVSAVSLATAATAAATIATAAVSVSAAIGVAGLAVSAVGMITKNKDLLKVGKIMGYVGLAGSLAGGALGGIGGLMEGGAGFINGASDAFAGASQHLSNAWQADKSFVSNLFQPDVAQGVVSGVDQTANTAISAANQTSIPGVAKDAQVFTANPSGMQATGGAHISSPEMVSSAQNLTGTGIADQGLAGQQLAANAGPSAPVAPIAPPTPTAPTTGLPPGGIQDPLNAGGLGMRTLGAAAGAPPTDAAGLWGSMPDYMKYATLTQGPQFLSGIVGGLFNGLSTEERLKFEKLVNQQRENQVQYQNQNNAYAPLVKFNRPTGFINQVPGARS